MDKDAIRDKLHKLSTKLGREVKTHDELRDRFLDDICKPYLRERIGLAVYSKLERSTERGFYDARIGSLLFEFKKPLSGIDDGIEDVKRYIKDLRFKVECFVTDGKDAAYVDRNLNTVERENLKDLWRTLTELLSTHAPRVIEPEDLLNSFAPESDLCQEHGRRLWNLFVEYEDTTSVRDYFDIWKRVYAEAFNLNKSAIEAVKRYASGFVPEISSEKSEVQKFLFIIQTYVSIFMKLLIVKLAIELRTIHTADSVKKLLETSTVKSYERMNGLPFLKGVFEHDVFNWFTAPCRKSSDAESKISTILWNMAVTIDKIDLSRVISEDRIDMLREIYQKFFDKETRKAMGEFYTNDDIVEEILNYVDYKGKKILDKVLLDPGCGSGTFLVEAIRRFIKEAKDEGLSNQEILERITNQIIGVDIHPFAVAMAKINYALTISDILKGVGGPSISYLKVPIYWSDSLAEFLAKEKDITTGAKRVLIKITTLKEPLMLPDPNVIVWDKVFDLIAKAIEESWEKRRFFEEFPEEVRWMYENTLSDIFDKFSKMSKEGRDGKWLPTIKNMLAVGEYKESCDFVVGNPPWVRRSNLDRDLRERIDKFKFYSGAWKPKLETELFIGDRDYSLAFVEAGMNYLKDGGRLGFVITSNVTRALYAGKMREELLNKCKILQIKDYSLSKKELFEDVQNAPLILSFEKTKAPDGHSVNMSMVNSEGKERNWKIEQDKLPLMDDAMSPWIIVPPKVEEALRKMQNFPILGGLYCVPMGVKTSANNIFFAKELKLTDSPDEVLVTTYRGRDLRVEKEVVRPLIRGRNINEWSYNVKDYIIWTHDDKTGGVKDELPPKARDYFMSNENVIRLKRRSDYKEEDPIWTIYRVSIEKLKEKVAYRMIAKKIEAVVLPSDFEAKKLEKAKLIVDHGVYFIPVKDKGLALRLAGFLNSTPARTFATSYVNRIAEGCQYFSWIIGLIPLANGVINDIKIGERSLTEISKDLHESKGKIEKKLKELDKIIARAYDLSDKDLKVMQNFLKFFVAG